MFYASSSVGNPGYHWIIGLKIKSYYQTLVLWSKLDQEKVVLFSKNGSLFSNPGQFYVSSSARNPGCHWITGLKIKSYYQNLPFWWRWHQEKALLFSKKTEVYLVTLLQYLSVHPITFGSNTFLEFDPLIDIKTLLEYVHGVPASFG